MRLYVKKIQHFLSRGWGRLKALSDGRNIRETLDDAAVGQIHDLVLNLLRGWVAHVDNIDCSGSSIQVVEDNNCERWICRGVRCLVLAVDYFTEQAQANMDIVVDIACQIEVMGNRARPCRPVKPAKVC